MYFQYDGPYNRSLLYKIVPVKVFEICILYAVCVSCVCVKHAISGFLTSLLSRRTSFSRKLYLHYFVLLYGTLLHSVAELFCNDLVAPEVLKLP
jgi:hypothetical protein